MGVLGNIQIRMSIRIYLIRQVELPGEGQKGRKMKGDKLCLRSC